MQRLFKLISASLQQSSNLSNAPPLEQLLPELNLDKKGDLGNYQSIFSWIESYLTHSVNTSHPYFNNRMWSEANLPSVLGEIVVAYQQTSACTYESAPVAVLMEQYMINKMLALVGFSMGEGQMTTGSSNANMIAMMIARNKVNNIKHEGLYGEDSPLIAFVSEDAHYSFDKAANILGIGTNHLIKIATNIDGQMDITHLKTSIIETIEQGKQPFFIGATLGTTVRGAYDDIAQIVPIAKQYGLWLHGDGAWGGAVIMHDELKAQYLPNINELDSFTMDFHKMLGTALMCNFLLVNHQGVLCETCSNGNTSYIFHNPLDLGIQSLQCGRRVDSLKWFLDWKFFGQSGFAKRVMHYYQIIDYAENKIEQSPQLYLVVKRQSFNLCFHYMPTILTNLESTNKLNQMIRTQLLTQSQHILSVAYVGEVFVFRLLVTHQQITHQHINQILNDITTAGEQLSK